ncbi:MAG: hypothetical protein ACNA8P_07830 [Phycisphaerales bacterium]
MPRLTAITAFCALTGSVWASPLTLEPLVIVGESYGDMPGVISQTSGESQINNSGQWVTRVAGTDAGGSFLGTYIFTHDGIRHDPFTVVPFNETLTFRTSPPNAFYSSINNHGQIATTFNGLVSDADGNLVGSRSMIAVDGSPVLRTGDTTPFGGTYGGFGSTRHILNDQGHLLANFDLFFNPFSTFETVIEFSPSESGYDQTVRMTPGMPLQDGYSVRSDNPANWGSFDFSNNGNMVFGVGVANSDLIARPAIVVNGIIRRMSGATDAFPDGEFSLFRGQVAINDSADFAYQGFMLSSDWEGGRRAIMRNEDEIVWIDDGSDPSLADYTDIGAGAISITEGGDVIWQALIQDSLGASWTALFHNDLVIATSDPNFLGDALFIEDGFSFDVSDNGQWIIFDTPHGIYRTLIPSPGAAAILALTTLSTTRRRRKPA